MNILIWFSKTNSILIILIWFFIQYEAPIEPSILFFDINICIKNQTHKRNYDGVMYFMWKKKKKLNYWFNKENYWNKIEFAIK